MRVLPLSRLRRAERAIAQTGVASTLNTSASGFAHMSSLSSQAQNRENVRRKNLVQLLGKGEISPQELSQQDQHLLGPNLMHRFTQKAVNYTVNPVGSVPGIFENLGSDVSSTFTNLPAGLLNLGKSAVEDIPSAAKGALDIAATPVTEPLSLIEGKGLFNPVQDNPIPNLTKNVIKPTIHQYNYEYGPIFRSGNFNRLAKHPLMPILDAATIASVGAGSAAKVGELGAGATATRAAEAGHPIADFLNKRFTGMAGIKARTGRPDIPAEVPGGEPVAQEYSPRPLMKYGVQKPLDAFMRSRLGQKRVPFISKSQRLTGAGETLQDTLRNIARRRELRLAESGARTAISRRTLAQSADLVKAVRRMSQDEQFALEFLHNGVNFQKIRVPGEFAAKPGIDEAIATWERSLANENPPGENWMDFQHPEHGSEVPKETIQEKINAARSPKVRSLVMHPTDAMRKADEAWRAINQDEQMQLPLEAADFEARRMAPIQALRREAIKDPSGAESAYATQYEAETGNPFIRAVYKPHDLNVGEVKRTGITRREKFVPGRTKEIPRAEKGVTPENIVKPRLPSYMRPYDMSALRAGVWRHDAGAMVKHIEERQRDIVQAELRDKVMSKALKDDGGEVQMFDKGDKLPPGYVLIHPEGLIQWYEAENDAARGLVEDILNQAPKDSEGHVLDTAELQGALQDRIDTDSRAFIQTHLGATYTKGVAIPVDSYNYLKAIIDAKEAAAHPSAWTSLMNKWRTATLAYMPRWWVNTLVGNSVLGLIAGSWRFGNLRQAHRLIATHTLPEEFGPGVHGGELMEGGGPMRDRGISTESRGKIPGVGRVVPRHAKGRITQGAFNANQYVENHLINMTAVSRLRQEARRQGIPDPYSTIQKVKNMRTAMRENGNILDAFRTRDIKDGMIDEMLQEPRLVEAAANEANHFFYNYNQLGPFERRYMRQIVPFWGWYKFITKLAYRLPVEYPGRANMMFHLSQVSKDTTAKEFGLLSPFMQGALILNADPHNLSYIGTYGLNPFGQIANPFSGKITDLLNLSQLNPLAQAGLTAAGINTVTGDATAHSPIESVAANFFGAPTDVNTGQPVPPGGRESIPTLIGTLARSFPQVRIAEQMTQGGNTVYPESIPFLRERPIVSASPRDTSPLGILGAATGLAPRTIDLVHEQKYWRSAAAYSRKRRLSDLKRLRGG